MSEVVPLITCGTDGQYRCDDDTLAWLDSIAGPVGVVAVAGKYRTGKSLLLNCICQTEPGDGFSVGSTVQACTKGLWIYRGVLKGAKCSILCVDTEGIDALDADSTHDVKIFTLALLLSSVFLYNSVGALDEAAMQTLGLVTRVVNNVRVECARECSASELAAHMPEFIWLLRDFSLRLVDREGRAQSTDQYFEEALHACSVDKEPVRKAIRETFRKRSLHTLPRPTADDAALQALEYGRMKMQRKFTQGVATLRNRLLEQTLPVRTDQHAMSGGMLASMCRTFAARMNDGGVPVIRDAWSLMESIRHRDAKQRILDAAPGAFKGADSRAALMTEFDAECPGADEMRAELAAALDEMWTRLSKEREQKQLEELEQELAKAYARVSQDPSQLPQALEHLNTAHPLVSSRLVDVWLPELVRSLATQVQDAQSESARSLRDLAEAVERHAQERRRLQEEMKALRQLELAADEVLPSDHASAPAELPENEPAQVVSQELSEAREARESMAKELAAYRERCDGAERDLRAAEDRVADVEAKNATLAEAARHIDAFRSELEASKSLALSRAKAEFEADLRKANDRVDTLSREAQRLSEELRASNTAVQVARSECQRSLEHALSMQASLQDGQERLLLSNRDLLDDSRIRDERHRKAYSELARDNTASEVAKAEVRLLKRTVESLQLENKELKRAKVEFEAAKQELLLAKDEAEHLRSSKREIIAEREEIRALLKETDRKLAVEQAARMS